MSLVWKVIHARQVAEKGKKMDNEKSTRSVIENYRKRRQQNQVFIVWGGAALLILVGIILLVIWLTGPSQPLSGLFATETPTPTLTSTPTPTSIPTGTPTVTPTSTETLTPTQSAPYSYIVQEGDFLATIAESQNLGADGVALILLLNTYTEEGANFSINPATQVVYPGQEILLPNPGMLLPTATAIPSDLPPGTEIIYTVQAGDTLAGIAALFNSTIEAIIEKNELDDPNAIFVGQQLIIPANLVTATATFPPTSTPLTPLAGTPSP
jgi:hypothetical protein